MTYAEKLKDPRWQKKRLEVLSHYNWCCCLCGDKHNTLHVHHDKYTGDPWEAPLESLSSLCECCHNLLHSFNVTLKEYITWLESPYLAPILNGILQTKKELPANSITREARFSLVVKITRNLIKGNLHGNN